MALNLATDRYAAIHVTMPWRMSLPFTNLVGLGAVFGWQRQMVAYLSRTPAAGAAVPSADNTAARIRRRRR